MKLKNMLLCTLGLATLAAMQACRKDDAAPAPAVVPQGQLRLHIHNAIGDNEVESLNKPYDAGNLTVIPEVMQFFISKIEAQKADGNWVKVSDALLLKTQDEEVYTVDSLPAGKYKAIRFRFGLDSLDNLQQPTGMLVDSSMWFTSPAQPGGYVYLDFKGSVDSAGTGGIPFRFKIGTPVNSSLVTLPVNEFEVVKGTAAYVHMNADYSLLFNGLGLGARPGLIIDSKADNSLPLARKVASNALLMFKHE